MLRKIFTTAQAVLLTTAMFSAPIFAEDAEQQEAPFGSAEVFGYVSATDYEDELEAVFFNVRLADGSLAAISFDEVETAEGLKFYTMDIQTLAKKYSAKEAAELEKQLKENPDLITTLPAQSADADQCYAPPRSGGRDYDIVSRVFSDGRCRSICIGKHASSYTWQRPRGYGTDNDCICYYN